MSLPYPRIITKIERAEQAYQKKPTPENLQRIEKELMILAKKELYKMITDELQRSDHSTLEKSYTN